MAALSSVDLELALRRWSGDDYALEARFQLSTSAAPAQLIGGSPPRVRLDFEALLEQQLDPDAYGVALGQAFFADPRVAEALAKARAQAESVGAPLRLRLRLAADDDELQALRWETLRSPDGQPLARSERILFARHLDSADMTPLQLGPRADLRALVAIAGPDPQALASYKLAPVDVPAETTRARAALADLPTTLLASGQGAGVTLDALVAGLRDGPDILYLVAHGALRRGRAYLWLDDIQAGAERVEGVELVEALARLPRRPLLVVLASCQSAGDGSGEALAALGPQLAAAGVAAVVAMQGNLRMDSAAALLPAFFRELWRDGQVDRALAAARLALRGGDDWWQPALFLRVPDGRIWRDAEPAAPAPSAGPAIPQPPFSEQPPELSGFVGRAAEIAAFRRTLDGQGMLVLTGMPGVGKTSVAAALARQAGSPATTLWHGFRPGEGAENLIWALAGYLAHQGRPGLWELLQGAALRGGQPPPVNVQIDYLVQLLADRPLLLCLDDLHLVDEDPQLEPLIARLGPLLRAGTLRIIATSWRVPDFAQLDQVDLLTGLTATDAARLLAARGVVLADAELAALLAQVGGNAQLLVLAADALRRAADPARLIARLAEADSIERYLLDSIDKALSAEERGTMKPIATLLEPGGTRAAIEVLADGANVRRPLRSLSDRHLLLTQEEAAGKVYRQHLVVQRFYYEELSRRERAELHRRAADFYQREEPDLLRAALHTLYAGEPARAAALVTSDIWALLGSGRSRALLQLLEQLRDRLDPLAEAPAAAQVQLALGRVYPFSASPLLARPALEAAWDLALGLNPPQPALQGEICAELGRFLRHSAPEEARDWLDRGLALLPADGLLEARADLLILRGSVQLALGAPAVARADAERGLALLPAGPSYPRLYGLLTLGRALGKLGDLAARIGSMEQALVLSEQLGAQVVTAPILISLGTARFEGGDWEDAAQQYRRASALAAQMGNRAQQALLQMNLGLVELDRGEDAAAEAVLGRGLELARADGLAEYALGCLSGLADLRLRRGEPELAAPLLDEAEALAAERALSFRSAELATYRAQLALARNAPAEALAAAEHALALARAQEDPYEEGGALRTLGAALLAQGRPAEALTALLRAVDLLEQDPYAQARARVLLARAWRQNGAPERSAALLTQARATFAHLGARRDLAELELIQPADEQEGVPR